MKPAPKACPLIAQIEGTGSIIRRPIKFINSFENSARSSEGALEIQSRSRPFEKNLVSEDEVTSAAGP